MKKELIFAVTALILVGCAKEINQVPEQPADQTGRVEYRFTAAVDTKATISDGFAWAQGDKIALWDAQNSTFDEFAAETGGATTTFTGTGAADADYTKAYYPFSAVSNASGENAVVWPASYTSADAAAKSFPMMAVNNNGALNFKHLGALLKLTIADLPSSVTSLVFNASSKGVSGTLAVDATDASAPFCAVGNSPSSITIPTDGAITSQDGTVFYLPLPTGTLTGGFHIDFRITSTNNKVVGTKTTTNNITLTRASLKPMKPFTPDFNWPGDTDAFDYGVALNSSKTATYPATERKTTELVAVYGEGGFVSGKKLKNTEGYLPSITLDKITYCAYNYTLTFNGNRFETSASPGPGAWVNESGFGGKIIPNDLCFFWKVNRPGKFSYPCVVFSNKTARPVSYQLAILKTVDGITSATTLIDFTPDTDSVHEKNTEGGTPKTECYHEFEVTTENLLGIDDAATLYFYGYTKNKTNQTFWHFPIKWTPSVAE